MRIPIGVAGGWAVMTLFWACGAPEPAAPPEDPIALAREFAARKSGPRYAAVLDLLAEDCVIEKAGSAPVQGREDIAGLLEYEAALRSRLTLADLRADPAEGAVLVTGTGAERNGFQAAAGLAEYVYPSVAFTIAGGRIRKIAITRSPETENAVMNFNVFFQGWLDARHPEEKGKLVAGGKLVRSRESAERLLRLVKEYRSSLQIIEAPG